jgi:hypothetical protein
MGGDDYDYELEIDLTAEGPDGLVPIRWVGADTAESVAVLATRDHTGNGRSNGNGAQGNGDRSVVRAHPIPRVATLASFIPPAVPTPAPAPEARVITLPEPGDWSDVPESVTLRRLMASRGARFVTVVAVVTVAALLAGFVLLWQRVEEPHRPVAPAVPTDVVEQSELVEVQNRLNSLETRLASLVDSNGAIANTPEADILAFQIAALKSCINSFQAAIDAGRVRGGQFAYC